MRNHWHVLLIAPLVVIVMTWPTFARIFDGDEFWLHVEHRDKWLRFWDAWHLERVLAGQGELYYTDSLFHPDGVSLAWQQIVYPHAALLLMLKKVMPADSAYNLLFLLILCFNAFCTYALIQHFIDDKWIALFGAVVAAVSVPFPHGNTSPDLIMLGTLPLTIYFLCRAIRESRWRFTALAGFCAGMTAFISLYVFVFILFTASIFAVYLALSRWRQPAFWRHPSLMVVICASISILRIYPIVADAPGFQAGSAFYQDRLRSNDVLDFFVLSPNPFSGEFLHALFNVPPDSTHKRAYLGYINLFFIGCAILHKPFRRRLAPWVAALVFFAVMRLGDYLTINSVAYTEVVMPERVLSGWFPSLFAHIGIQEYYQVGAVLPLALLSSFGLARLMGPRPARLRAALALASAFIVACEFYQPRYGQILEESKTAYIDWLGTEAESPINLINLPLDLENPRYFLYLQTLTDRPNAFGFANRRPRFATPYIHHNLLLSRWNNSRSVHCLPHNERTFLNALDRLLDDGFTHVVVHNWLYGDQFINHSFRNAPASYVDESVSVYRLPNLRRSCDSSHIELAPFSNFAASPSVFPGRRASILSFHPNESINEDRFAYLASLFSDWRSLAHLYLDGGEPVMQSAGMSATDLESFARDNQVIYLIYNLRDLESATLPSQLPFERFNLCRRDEHQDGSVIEIYLSRDFSCALVNSSQPLQVDYDNGARLVNASLDVAQDQLALQMMWSDLPSETHSVSLQVFDREGAKVLGQDAAIGSASLKRYYVDVSDLEPGEYAVKLIVYDFETRRSVPGTLTGIGTRFERELLIKTFTRT